MCNMFFSLEKYRSRQNNYKARVLIRENNYKSDIKFLFIFYLKMVCRGEGGRGGEVQCSEKTIFVYPPNRKCESTSARVQLISLDLN